MDKNRKLYSSLDETVEAHKLIIEINQRNEKLYGPYHELCGHFKDFCICLGENNIRTNKKRFKIGDKLEASQFDREHHDLEWVVITSINEENKVYHWEADDKLLGGKIHSGYFFNEAKLHKEQ